MASKRKSIKRNYKKGGMNQGSTGAAAATAATGTPTTETESKCLPLGLTEDNCKLPEILNQQAE